MPALFLDFIGNRKREPIRDGAFDRLVAETADAVELCIIEPVEQRVEIRFGLAGETDDEGRTDRELRAGLPPLRDPRQRLFLRCRAAHAAEDTLRRMLKRDVQVGQDLALRHELDRLVHMGGGIVVMQENPDAEIPDSLGNVEKPGSDLASLPFACGIFNVAAVSRSVLRDDEELLDPGGDETLGFAQDVASRSRHETSSQLGNDAERTTIVAAL